MCFLDPFPISGVPAYQEVVPSFSLGSRCPCRSPALRTATATQSSYSESCVLVPDSCMEVDPTSQRNLHGRRKGLDEQKIDKRMKRFPETKTNNATKADPIRLDAKWPQ